MLIDSSIGTVDPPSERLAQPGTIGPAWLLATRDATTGVPRLTSANMDEIQPPLRPNPRRRTSAGKAAPARDARVGSRAGLAATITGASHGTLLDHA